jgi:hypothetical protein
MLVKLYKKIKTGKISRYQLARLLSNFSHLTPKERFITEFSKKFVEKAEQLVTKAKLKAIAKKELTNSDLSNVLAEILNRQMYQEKNSLTTFLVALMLYAPDEFLSNSKNLIEFQADEHLKNSDVACINCADIIKLNGWKIRIAGSGSRPLLPFYHKDNLKIRTNKKNKSAVLLFTQTNYDKTQKDGKTQITLKKIEITKNFIKLYFEVFTSRYHRRYGTTKKNYLAVFEIIIKNNEIKLKRSGRVSI